MSSQLEKLLFSFWKKAGAKDQKLDMERKLKAKRASARDRAKEDNIQFTKPKKEKLRCS